MERIEILYPAAETSLSTGSRSFYGGVDSKNPPIPVPFTSTGNWISHCGDTAIRGGPPKGK